MEKIRETIKKLLAVLAAAVFVFCGATVAFADESSEAGNVTLSESKEEFDFGESAEKELNYSVLERQITIAIGINEHGYTSETRNALEKALDEAISLLDKAGSQQEIDSAAEKLESAVSGLVPMDYSGLEKNLGLIYGKIEESAESHDVWSRIDAAVEKSKTLLLSGDQAAVDSAAAELESLLEELSDLPSAEPETIIKEVQIEVPPSDDFCNIAGHKAWPVLFFISLAINAALAVLIGYVFSKIKNSEDDIPLVKYDIDDDINDFDDFDDPDDYDDFGEEDFADESDEKLSDEESEED